MKSIASNLPQVSFDYISDIHLDFWKLRPQFLRELIKSKKKSKYLIIAGDIGHNLNTNLNFLVFLQQNFSEIFVVLGNHDRYIMKQESFLTGKEKAAYTRELYTEIGIKVLDGNLYEVDGVTIGGADGWYDGSYLAGVPPFNNEKILELWRNSINDYRLKASPNFYATYQEELEKIKSLHGKVDVMVTHVRPTIRDEHTHAKYKSSHINAFFGFDYEAEILKDKRVQVWVYGHTHNRIKFPLGSCEVISNPLGYPNENEVISLETFWVNVGSH